MLHTTCFPIQWSVEGAQHRRCGKWNTADGGPNAPETQTSADTPRVLTSTFAQPLWERPPPPYKGAFGPLVLQSRLSYTRWG